MDDGREMEEILLINEDNVKERSRRKNSGKDG